MQTCQIVLRERCEPVTVFVRRRRFLVGARATGGSGIKPLARLGLVTAGGLLLFTPTSAAWAQYVTVKVEVDNCAAVYSGRAGGSMITAHSDFPTTGPANGIATYSFIATPDDEYLYIAAWSDDRNQQGLLAEIGMGGGRTILSGSAVDWEVFATNIHLGTGGGKDPFICGPQPDATDTPTSIGAQIDLANGGGGWGPVAVGGRAGFPVCNPNPWIVSGIDLAALWMWYDSGGQTPVPGCSPPPLYNGFDHDEYLIFRTKIQCVIPPPGMVAWWALDEQVGSTTRDSVDNNDGTLKPFESEPIHTPAYVNYGLQFDGVNDYVDVPPNSTPLKLVSSDLTVDAWIKWDSTSTSVNDEIVAQTGWRLYVVKGPTSAALQFLAGNCTASAGIQGNQWQHVAATLKQNPGTLSVCLLYVNGQFIEDGFVPTISNLSTDGAARIGASLGGGNNFKGLIDEVEVFNRVLSQDEIEEIYHAGQAGKCKTGPRVGACCLSNNGCELNVTQDACVKIPGRFLGVGTTSCLPHDASGDCIPALSEWGVVVMAMLVLTAGTIVVMRRRAAMAA